MKDLAIDGNGLKTKKLIGLEDALKAVESENQISKVRIDQLQKTANEQQKEMEELKESIKGLYLINVHYPMTVERRLINRKTGKYEKWTETINTPEEMEIATKKFQERVEKVSKEGNEEGNEDD